MLAEINRKEKSRLRRRCVADCESRPDKADVRAGSTRLTRTTMPSVGRNGVLYVIIQSATLPL